MATKWSPERCSASAERPFTTSSNATTSVSGLICHPPPSSFSRSLSRVETSLEATFLRNNEEPSPEGSTEFSPALQRWGEGSELQVPYGQLSFSSILR